MSSDRIWKSLPDPVEVTVDGHRMTVQGTGDDTLHVAVDNRRGHVITIRGIEYVAYANYTFEDGQPVLSRHGIGANKLNPRDFRDKPSAAAEKAIEAILVQAARIYRHEHRETMREAGRISVNNRIQQLDGRIAEKQKELDDLLLEKAGMLVEESEMQGAAPAEGWRAPA